MADTKDSPDRMSIASTTSMASASTLPTVTSVNSLNSRYSINSSLSLSTVGESRAHEQRPKLVTPALKTPTWPSENGIFSTICATTIRAPLALVTLLLLDCRTYPQWNTFCPNVKIIAQPKSTAPLPPFLDADPVLGSIANNHTTLRDGTSFMMDVVVDPNDRRKVATPSLQVTRLEAFERDGRMGVRIAWRIKGKIANLLTRSERVQEILPATTAGGLPCCEYVCWETYYGMLASSMKNFYGKQLVTGYAAWMDGLKDYAEERSEELGR